MENLRKLWIREAVSMLNGERDIKVLSMSVHLPKGEWWFGDPCYILTDEKYGEILSELRSKGGNSNPSVSSNKFCVAGTTHGDGLHRCDYSGREYSVDSGLLGIISADIIEPEYDAKCKGISTSGSWFSLPEGGTFEITEQRSFGLFTPNDETLLWIATRD